MQGFKMTSARKTYLQNILLQYGVKFVGDELVANVPISGFAQKTFIHSSYA